MGGYIQYPKIAAGGGGGGVSSVGLSLPTSLFAISGSPVTSSGTLTGSFKNQNANLVFAGPDSGSAATPTMRSLVLADLPTINFSNISGTLAGSQLPTFTGDVTNSAAAMTVAKIAGVAVGTPTGTGNVVFSANPTFSGSMIFGNYHVEPSEHAYTASSSTLTVDLSTGSAQAITLGASVTLTLSNPQTGGAYVFRVIQGSGSYTVTWPSSVKWPGGTAPVITTVSGQVDLINLYWNGTDYFGSFTQNYTP